MHPSKPSWTPTIAGLQPFPIFMSAGWIVTYFVLTPSSLHHLWRPLAIVTIVATALAIAVAVMFRGRPWAILVGGTAIVAAVGAWLYVAVLVGLAAWRLVIDAWRRRSNRQSIGDPAPRHIARLANVLSATGLAVALLRVLITVPSVPTLSPPESSEAEIAGERLQSIYLVMLDGYPRADTLASEYGIDNGQFLAALAHRQFSVASESRSNYSKTQLTLTTMLHARYADDIGHLREPTGDYAEELRQVSASINGPSAVMDVLTTHGYWTVSVPPSFGEVALLRAHQVIESPAMTQFEEQLVRTSILGPALSVIRPTFTMEQHRAAVEGNLAAFEQIADTELKRPMFAYVHVLSPHTPFVFGANGSLPPPAPCYPGCGLWDAAIEQLGYTKAEYAMRLEEQLGWLNARLLEAIDDVISDDPNAVIILMSDHGSRAERSNPAEYFRNFVAARTPHHASLFPDDIHTVNVLSATMNAYLSEDFEQHDYRAWLLGKTVLELVPFRR